MNHNLNTGLTQKFLLVIALVTLIISGGLTGASDATTEPSSRSASITSGISTFMIAPANLNASLQHSKLGNNCPRHHAPANPVKTTERTGHLVSMVVVQE